MERIPPQAVFWTIVGITGLSGLGASAIAIVSNMAGHTSPTMDQLFGTFHDGSEQAQKMTRVRMLSRIGDEA